ncbi:olfactory receptor 2C1-like [Archocentrus centrarchus]|uniref:olfactory receptor 2C1-like n=1 Tax=Archocentrus centrarchus TaxID=63155 RepID=UPI0011E9D62B|nr:olfactory receptor 2C1-like [Archocentrus centrarchus]
MMSAGVNVTSLPIRVTSLTLDGLAQLSSQRFFFFFFLCAYLFMLCSDSLVVYVICSERSLHRPMFVFVAALLVNSVAGGTVFYPKLLVDLLGGGRSVQVTLRVCVCQAWLLYSVGTSSFLLLGAMSFDRYVSICRPLRYTALMSPASVAALLLLCWLLPVGLVGSAVLLASQLPLCRSQLSRLFCDIYSLVSLSCGGRETLLSEAYNLSIIVATVLLPSVFVLFSYSAILSICLRRSRSFSSKALSTCLPHLLVFCNYSVSSGVEVLQRRLQADNRLTASVLTSILQVMIPTVFNPVVYGLKVTEIRAHLRRLLGFQRAH